MEKEIEETILTATNARNLAYAPYSKFKVGAAIRLTDGTIITGCNIENASYGLSNCAERTALFKTYSQGYQKNDIKYMVIVADCSEPVSPCGACRQVMAELMHPNAQIIMSNLKMDRLVKTVAELLPYHFDGDMLNV